MTLKVLNVSNLNTYYGESHVLRDVAVAVNQGEVVVMLGPNGHGKSTLLKSICGLVDQAKGKIIYKNADFLCIADNLHRPVHQAVPKFRVQGTALDKKVIWVEGVASSLLENPEPLNP